MGETLSVLACLTEISTRLTDAAAIARAAVTCAESGSEREAVRIAIDLDEVLHEAATLHRAMAWDQFVDRAVKGCDLFFPAAIPPAKPSAPSISWPPLKLTPQDLAVRGGQRFKVRIAIEDRPKLKR